MDYPTYKNHLKVCQYLSKEPVGIYGHIHLAIKELWKNMTITPVQYVDKSTYILFHKEDVVFMKYDVGDDNIVVYPPFKDLFCEKIMNFIIFEHLFMVNITQEHLNVIHSYYVMSSLKDSTNIYSPL
jgi:hypothetical protein